MTGGNGHLLKRAFAIVNDREQSFDQGTVRTVEGMKGLVLIEGWFDLDAVMVEFERLAKGEA